MLQSGSPVRGKAAWPWWCRPLKALGGGVSVPETMTASRAQCQAPRRSKQAMALGRGCRLVKSAYWAVTTTRSGGAEGCAWPPLPAFSLGTGKAALFQKKMFPRVQATGRCAQGVGPGRGCSLSLPWNGTKGTALPQRSFWSLAGAVPRRTPYDVAVDETETRRPPVRSPSCRQRPQSPAQ